MKSAKYFRQTMIVALGFATFVLTSTVASADDDDDEKATYKVTIENLTPGQPFSPPVVATHRSKLQMFRVGETASPELEAIAEDGNQIPMFDLFNDAKRVTEAVDIGRPLTPSGQVVGDFTDAVTFDIESGEDDRLSMATMLICTNDGFTGLDRIHLPSKGAIIRWPNGYDAGTEDNTELSQHIVDACTALGPVALSGDPNGNENALVDTDPHMPIQHHRNIAGVGDLLTGVHTWSDPTAKVTITRISEDADEFFARLSGVGEVPSVQTSATGRARFELDVSDNELKFKINTDFIVGVTQAHIHIGLPNVNGPVVAFLFGPADPMGVVQGRLSRGTISAGDLIGPLAGNFEGFLQALRSGELYVNVHTEANPGGEVRGQIGMDD